MNTGETAQDAALTLDSIGDAVLTIDIGGHVTYLNPAAEVMTGWSRADAEHRPIDTVFHIIDRETRDVAPNPLRLAVRLNTTVGLTPNCALVRRDGQETAIEDSAAPIRDANGQVVGAVIVFRDVGAALETSRRMTTLAQHDPLTGLPNRLLLHDRLSEAIALRHRHHKNLAVCFVDVDGFKDINDSQGHGTGDLVLQSIAQGMVGSLRNSDTVCRYGGDEFVIVLSELERVSHAIGVCEKLQHAAAGPHRVNGRDVALTASLGVAVYPDHGDDATTLITNADAAMYDAKRSGLGACRLFDPGTHARTPRRMLAPHVRPSPAAVMSGAPASAVPSA